MEDVQSDFPISRFKYLPKIKAYSGAFLCGPPSDSGISPNEVFDFLNTIYDKPNLDMAAYTTIKNSEAELTAADNQASAQIKLATAKKGAAELEAKGEEAKALVPVTVAAEQVKVDQSKVIVLKSELEAKTANQAAAVALQLDLARIEADKAVGIAMAESIGKGLAAANLNIYGDTDTFRSMLTSLTNGQRTGRLIEGVLNTTPQQVTDLATSTIGAFSAAASGVLKKLTGQDVTAETIAAAVKAEMAKGTTDPEAAA